MNARGSALLLVGVAAGGGAAMAVVYGVGQGLVMAGLLLLTGGPVLVLAHMFLRRRGRMGSLTRQFALGVGLAIGLALLAVGLVASVMFVSVHDAFTLGLLLAVAAALAAWSALGLARAVMGDIERVRDGVRAVGAGARDVRIETSARDELAELAVAGNRMIEQLAEREAERDAAEAARRALTAAVSHDLRTPLASLGVLAEAIDGEVVDRETRRRYAGQLGMHVRSLGNLIDDLFELSRLEAGEVQWTMQAMRLEELVEETVEAMQPQASLRDITARARLPAGLPAAHANPEKVQRVLFNLIENAIRHTPAHGTITVGAEAVDGHVEVEVRDSGAGIAADDRSRAFDPFWRGGSETPRTRSGAGLGLTICRAIVEAHGGRIWLPESSEGARVRFSLPRAA